MSGAPALDEYQQRAARTINPALDDGQCLLDAACGLAEEAGEVLAHVRKHVMQGRALDRDAVREELGDALWCLAITARSAGLSLGEVADANLAKLASRHPHGFPTSDPPTAPDGIVPQRADGAASHAHAYTDLNWKKRI